MINSDKYTRGLTKIIFKNLYQAMSIVTVILVRITSVDYHLEKQVLLVCEKVFIELFEGFSTSKLNFMYSFQTYF